MLPNRGAGLWSGLSLPSAGHPHSLFKPIFLFYFLTAGFLFLDTPPPPPIITLLTRRLCFPQARTVPCDLQVPNPLSKTACLSPGELQSPAERLRPRQPYLHPAPSPLLPNQASPSPHLPKRFTGNLRHLPLEAYHPFTSQKKFRPPAWLNIPVPCALGLRVRSSASPGWVHSSEPPSGTLGCRQCPPQGVFPWPLLPPQEVK